MADKIQALGSILLILLGVAIILSGFALANQGRVQMDVAAQWEPPTTPPCTIPTSALPDDYANKSIVERHHIQAELADDYCTDSEPPKNPYKGGETKIGGGFLIALLGSAIIHRATR